MSYSGIRNSPLSHSKERGIPAEVFLPRAKKRKEYVLSHKQFVGIGASILLSGLISAGIVKALIVLTPMACKWISIAANNVLRSQSTTDLDKRNPQERIASTLRRNIESSEFIETFFGVSPVLIPSFNDGVKSRQILQILSHTYANETVTLRLTTEFHRDYEVEIDKKGSIATDTRTENVLPHVKLQKFFSRLVKRYIVVNSITLNSIQQTAWH